jgi:hypothetical protein
MLNLIKEVVICYAVYDTNDQIDFTSSSCLQKISILEILVNRWIPKENRDTLNQKIPVPDSSGHAVTSMEGFFESFDHLDD